MKQPEVQPLIWKRSFVVLTLLAVFLSATVHGAQAVTLAWDPSPGPGVVGYKIHYGETSGAYTSVHDAGNSTNATLSTLLAGHTYFFGVCAYNSSAVESDPSNEVQYTVPTPANSPPVANNSSVQGNEDQTVAVPLSGSDPDGNPLTYAIVAQPVHGTLSGTAPNLTYRPQTNYNGPDSFTFRVNDGTTNSGTATVSLTVAPVNDPPVAANGSATTTEDATASVLLSGSDVEGGTLSYAIVAQPTHGTLSGAAPNLTYRPQTNYSGPDSFTFRVNDGTTNSATATVSITVTAVNDPPLAIAQSVTTSENAAVAVTLTGSDPEGSALTYAVVASPTHGTLSGTAPNLTYIPQGSYNGPDTFAFQVNDGTTNSPTATVSVTVAPVNSVPVASSASVTTPEDAIASLLLSGSDADGDPLSYSVVNLPTHGMLSGTAPNLAYTPQTNYSGPDSFTFRVNDGTTNSGTATVSLTVTPVNDAPVAINGSATTTEDTTASVLLSGSDVEGGTLSYAIVAQPTHGTLSGTAPNLTYRPQTNYSGPDSFTFRVNDGTTNSGTATVSLTVTPVNDPPIAANGSATTVEDTTVNVLLSGSDVDGGALTYAIVAQPTHGSLSGTAPNLTYRPQTNYFGADSFTFRVNDGSADSMPATVSISVTAVNDAPVAFAGTLNTSKNTAASIALSGSDAEGSALTFTVVSVPTHGSLTGQPPNLTYRPQTNYYGADNFTFRVNDGSVDSGLATVSITVQGTNAVPVAQNQSRTTSEDASVAIVLNGSDADGNSLTYSVVSAPANGQLSGTAPNLTYRPNTNFYGADSFTFKANDGLVDSALATVSITVNSVNDGPIATNQSVTTAEDTTVNVLLSGSDVDGGALTYAIVAQPTHGSLSGTAPNVTYRPQTNYSGPDSFTFRVNDGVANSGTATVSLSVTPVNDPPAASAVALTTPRNTAASIALSGSDVEGSALTYAVVSSPTQGSLSGQPPNLTYQPNANYTGSDSFTFKVNDGYLDSALATVLINVKNGNRRPRAHSNSVTTAEDTPAAITLSGTDDDGDALSYTVVDTPANGVLSGEAPDLIFTPNADYNGQDSLTFEVNDGTENSLTATVTFTVTAVNDPPIAVAESVATPGGTPTNVVLTATDPDGDALTYSIVRLPSHGTLSGQGVDQTYTPNGGYVGTDSFDFVANDGTDNSSIATVSITVTSVNTAPTISSIPDQVTTQNVATVAIAFVVGDAQTASGGLILSGASSNPSLVPEANIVFGGSGASRTVTLTPALDHTGTTTITVTVSDEGLSATQSFIVTVNAAGPATPVYLALEAEAAALVSPMTIASDTNASGGRYIASAVNDTGLATFSVDIPVAGDYVVWCRVLSPTNWLDSFYVSADGGTEYEYGTAQNRWTNAWQWSALVIAAGPAPRVFPFAAGNHTIVFRGREADTALDQIVITNDRTFVPDGGVNVTVPNTSVSSLTVDPAGVATITWAATPGRSYRVFYKTNLSDPMWRVLGEDIIATGTSTLKQDYVTGNRFYGVAQLP